jgi:hypothetical protein
MMKRFINKIIAFLAISGLAIGMASPALASTVYDPNDQFFDPSGTYVAPVVPPVVPSTPAASDGSTSPTTGDSGTTPDTSGNSGQTNAAATTDGSTSLTAGNSGTSSQNTTGTDTSQNSNAVQPSGGSTSSTTDNSSTGAPTGDNSTVSPNSSNSQTGSDSNNNSNSNSGSNQNANLTNSATVNSNVTGGSNTGDNVASDNTGSGSVDSGNADLAANILNLANTIIAGAPSLALPIINYFGNLVGDVAFNNSGDTAATVTDNSTLSQIASNFLTGSDSNNSAKVDNNSNSNASVNNNGGISGLLNLLASTGGNDASKNTGDGSIATGNANVASNVVNMLNNTILASNWWLGMVNIFGNWAGNLLLPSMSGSTVSSTGSTAQSAGNSTTGSDSNNIAKNSLNQNSDLNLTNGANIVNGVNINANTGTNDASKNTLGGNIQTGDTNITDNQATIANNTIVGGSWWMVLVNTLQGWAGAIVGAPDGSTTFVPYMYGSTATNATTGADSNNIAVVDSNQNQNATISNTAGVNNDITLTANTGDNTASKNTGSGSITTGDANVMSNLVNFVNNTFNVQNWLFGIVNVFGTWTGNAQFGAGDSGTTIPSSETGSANANNSNTGADSNNVATIDNHQSTDWTINNNLNYQQSLNVKANTGKNTADKNTGSGDIQTGNINAKESTTVLGNITNFALNGSSDPGSDISAGNSDTGFGSNNNAIVKMFGKLKMFIQNSANVVKNFAFDLNTGKNSSDKNTLNGTVTTGDIQVQLNDHEVYNAVNISLISTPQLPTGGKGGGSNPPEEVLPTGGLGGGLGSSLPLSGSEELAVVAMISLALSTVFVNRRRIIGVFKR